MSGGRYGPGVYEVEDSFDEFEEYKFFGFKLSVSYDSDLTFDNVRYVILGTIRDESKAPEYLIVEASPSGIKLDWQLI